MNIIYLEKIESTNDYMKNKENKQTWDTVYAKMQTMGRGRRGKNWYSGEGGAWFSTCLEEDNNIGPAEWSKLPLIVCYAVLNMLEKETSLVLEYKWTNDIYHDERKIAGILIEKSDGFFIIGIGINVNNIEFGDYSDIATSVKKDTGNESNVNEIVEKSILAIEEAYGMFLRGEWPLMLEYLRGKDFLNGRKIEINNDGDIFTGRACGIGNNGELLVECGGIFEKISSGDIFWR